MFREFMAIVRQLFTWFVIVNPWELGVRTRFGKNMRSLEPGIHVLIPFIDRAYIQSVRRRMSILPSFNVTMNDKVTLTIGAYLSFEINDVSALFNTLHDANDTIDSIAVSLAADYIANNTNQDITPKKLEKVVNESIDLEKYGIINAQFYVSNFVRAKAHRFITGEIKQWGDTEAIDTSNHYTHGDGY